MSVKLSVGGKIAPLTQVSCVGAVCSQLFECCYLTKEKAELPTCLGFGGNSS